MERAEHLAWCKKRALEYLETGDFQQCAASFISDMGKHPDTAKSMEFGAMLIMIELQNPNKNSMRRCIEGFN